MLIYCDKSVVLTKSWEEVVKEKSYEKEQFRSQVALY